MRTAAFDIAVQKFLDALTEGDSIEAVWEELAELHGINAADLQRALQRAEELEAETESWDE
jgi:uncharacterized protein (DUF433 family)